MVLFVSKAKAAAEFRKLGFDETGIIDGSRAANRMKWSAFTYQSRVKNAEQIADALADHLGDFSKCVVWACQLVFGDHTGEDSLHPDWKEYDAWRTSHGASAVLGATPGHVFSGQETGALRRLVEFALYLGWDTLIKSDATKTVIKLSHDDRIELYYLSSPTKLKLRLGRLCEPAPWFDPRPRFS